MIGGHTRLTGRGSGHHGGRGILGRPVGRYLSVFATLEDKRGEQQGRGEGAGGHAGIKLIYLGQTAT
jgi:hypothetical protein